MEADIYEQILLLNERSPIIETLKYSDKHKKLHDSILLDKLKLDGELKGDQERLGEEVPTKNTWEGEGLPHGIHTAGGVGGEGRSTTTLLAYFMLLDVPIDRDVSLIVGRNFMYTCGAIMDTLMVDVPVVDPMVTEEVVVRVEEVVEADVDPVEVELVIDSVDDRDVDLAEEIVKEKVENQARAIKRRKVMVEKEKKDGSQ
ncbi:hypothetical protein Tco_0891906 [Tanacetum coccineum]|uniref:Uncharacterized protein n=1 Tax=Tanacetum coccineum TaxID=301880 RepID=A0ABQ5CAD6_9ASTR